VPNPVSTCQARSKFRTMTTTVLSRRRQPCRNNDVTSVTVFDLGNRSRFVYRSG
jgi:hypothetical protein